MSISEKKLADICIIGLAVMGENLALNFESKGYCVAVHNRSTNKIDKFLSTRAKNKNFIGIYNLETDLIKNMKKPCIIMLMVKAGEVVDIYINKLLNILSANDIIIDGGNSNFHDTTRRVSLCSTKNILYIGTGVSGGEEGALKGPSIMPGGNYQAWSYVKQMLQDVSAKVGINKDIPCCDWIGNDGSGHFVKTIHNGIEYGDIQLICEAYDILKQLARFTNDELAEIFHNYNKGDLNSYLIEITSEILNHKEEEATTGGATNDDQDQEPKYTLDYILDKAGQKGTGKWTAITALDLGMPVTLIGEAVFARCLSAQKKQRIYASSILKGPKVIQQNQDQDQDDVEPIINSPNDKEALISAVKDALYASKIVSYAQGFVLIKSASETYQWNVNYGNIALMWRGGCIIRSTFLDNIKDAFDHNPNLDNLLLDQFFVDKLQQAQQGWRKVIKLAIDYGIPCPAFMSALSYYDGYRTKRLPANLLQAQRDYFGAHTYERIDQPEGQFFHTNWTGRGGSTTSNSYTI